MENSEQYKLNPGKSTKIWTFKTNWNNKLDCSCFTTFRMYKRANLRIGQPVICQLFKGEKMIKQELRKIGAILPYVLREVPAILCYLDTGYSKEEFITIVETMYKNRNVDFTRECFAFYLLIPHK